MRIILDTNILISVLISTAALPDLLWRAWQSSRFTLLTSQEQLDEFRRVTRYPRVRRYVHPSAAGTMLNQLRLASRGT